MKTIREIRFIATNFYNLQGLRTVPLSLLMVLVVFWANRVQYPLTSKSYYVVVLEMLGTMILIFGIDRYYLKVFGQVKRTPESRRLEWLVSIVSGILAAVAFWLDISFKLPLSLVGLVFGVGLVVDYIRITWLVKGRYLLYYPIGAILMIGVSILPLLGAPHWWQAFGLKSQMYGVVVVIGIFSIFAGIWGHIFLVNTLSSKQDKQ